MYFPTSTARRLSIVPALPNIPPENVLTICPSPRKSLFCTLTRNGISIWRVRPSANLAFLSRTPISIIDHGENIEAHWSPDGSRIVIKTSDSYLVLVTVIFHPDETIYQAPPLSTNAQRNFLAGPGEAFPLSSVSLQFEGVIRVEGTLISVSPRKQSVMFSTQNPPAIQRIPWPASEEVVGERGSDEEEYGTRRRKLDNYDQWIINDGDFGWLVEPEVTISQILHDRNTGVESWIASDGRAYIVYLIRNDEPSSEELPSDSKNASNINLSESHQLQTQKLDHPRFADGSRNVWMGTCIHDFETPRWVQKQRRVEPEEHGSVYFEPRRAVRLVINAKFSLIAVGMLGGGIQYTTFPADEGAVPTSQQIEIHNPFNRRTGRVCSMEWSSDGYVLAVGWQHGWGLFSVGGRCLVSGFGVEDVDEQKFQDTFMNGVVDLFWAPGNFELIVLAQPSLKSIDEQLFVIPFAKSATTGQHSPDNTRYAFLQLEDRALVYRGADQPDISIINPESDVWQHIKVPQSYLAANWPIRYSSLSSDGRLIAIAGRRGLVHYSASSGRWKLFTDPVQEQAFSVQGGLLWFHHIRLYSRDLELSNQNVLHREVMPSPVIILSLVDNSLLVYCADNTLFHFLIIPTADTIKLHLCGSITFNGVIATPSAVRMLSWMIPSAQKQLGDPVNDLAVATVLMVVGGQLVLLRPRKSAKQEVKYDMQIFAERIEFCWIHLRGIAALENSLWAFDGRGIRVWLNALAIEAPATQDQNENPESVKESVNIPLEFYPLSVLMDKGIIIGAEHEVAARSNLPFVMFRHATSSHLFLHHILRSHLEASQVKDAVVFASHYQDLVYFAHALEILLHDVVEHETDLELDSGSDSQEVLPKVVEFLDYFDAALDVVVGCARKTEMTRWRRLFDVVGNPKTLFETCLQSHRLKTAGSYLLVLHNLEQLDEKNVDAIRLLKSAMEEKDWQLCRELLRFLRSIDDSGVALRDALAQTGLA
ncbi:RIC1-domain-containing protein [Lentinula edodes]|uniref:RIC1-domain-containing protein n=1 Tax=Lentinula edodes TaxID=5353 RepID=UPI001E8E12C5|nr:RIC1-domain-containing protein [Lentinula edodes]KAH7880335.1 RIC1-domain-containing protein [Lentinula edodes]